MAASGSHAVHFSTKTMGESQIKRDQTIRLPLIFADEC
jgi:hypothetical protein